MFENSADRCKSEHQFDYDNDGWKEDFCYVIQGSILVIDFDGNKKIEYGYEMLNFVNTKYENFTPLQFFMEYPDTCEQFQCYPWDDTNHDFITQDEFVKYNDLFDWDTLHVYPDGIKENDRYKYCDIQTESGENAVCLMPTYWQKRK